MIHKQLASYQLNADDEKILMCMIQALETILHFFQFSTLFKTTEIA